MRDEFKSFANVIDIKSTNTATFEIDIIEENKTDPDALATILMAIKWTRPKSGDENFAKEFKKTLNNDSFFNLIEPKNKDGDKIGDFKSEFATNLADIISLETRKFIIPKYIQDGFNFLIPKEVKADEVK